MSQGPFREGDIETRIARLEERIDRLLRGEVRVRVLDFLREHYVPQTVGFLVGLVGIATFGFRVQACHAAEDAAARQQEVEDEARHDPNAVCRALCESMGLRGGVITDYHSTGSSADGSYTWTRTGHSCMCGNGMGGSVRVDPDGRWSSSIAHPGPAVDGGT